MSVVSVLVLLVAVILPCRATSMAPVEINTPFGVGPIQPDPTRNVVYLVDSTYNRLLAFNTANGQQVAAAGITNGITDGSIAISVDDNTLYLSESNQNQILSFSLPDLTPTGTLTTTDAPYSLAATAGGRLFAAGNANTDEGYINEIDTTNGSTLQTLGTYGDFYGDPYLRANAAGTHLYASTHDSEGILTMEQYTVTGTQTPAATGYQFNGENLKDFEPDETNGLVYVMCGGVYGVELLRPATDSYSGEWPFTQPYGEAVSYNPANSVVFAASASEVAEFNRTTGVRLNDWVVGQDDANSINGAGLAATINNNVIYVRSAPDNTAPDQAVLGFISTTGLGLTLVPTLTDTLTFTPSLTGAPGQQVNLQASDLSGLAITFSVVSGPATIQGGVLTFTGEGTVVVEAVTAGNSVYKVTTSSQSITVAKQAQTIAAFAVIPNKVYKNPAFAITSPAASSGLPVALSVQSGPATISGNVITVTGIGAVTLAANQPGNTVYTAATQVTTSFLVNPAPQTIAAFPAIVAKPANAKPFTVAPPRATSGLPAVLSIQSGPATISGNIVTVTATGNVTLAANQAGNADYLAAPTVTTTFAVTGVPQAIAAFRAVGARAYTTAPFAITPPVATSRLPVVVTVHSGPATISGNDVTLTGTGTVVLAADQAGNSIYAAAPQVTTTFVVSPARQTIAAFTTIPTQVYGEAPFTLTPPVASSGLPVTIFVVSGPATISANTVTILGVGTIKLAAAQAGNAHYLAATEVTTTFAAKAGQAISPFATIPVMTYGQAPFTITPPTSSSNLAVAVKVLSGPATILAGRITLTGAGTVTLAANQAGNATFAPAPQVTTSFSVGKESQTVAAFKPIPARVYGAAPFVVAAPAATSKLPVTLSVLSGPATISGTKVTITGAGMVTLAADQAGNANFLPATEVTTTFLVGPAPQSIAQFAAIATKPAVCPPFAIVVPMATSHLPVTLTILSGEAELNGTTITVRGLKGTIILAANQTGNTDYLPAPQVTTTFAVK